MNIKVLGNHDNSTIEQLVRCTNAENGSIGVLCADGHKGYSMPIGGVVGYRQYVSPSGVGYDIACGNMAVRTNLHIDTLTANDKERIADEIVRRVSFGIGRHNNEPVNSPVFDRIEKSPVKEQRALLQLARNQLGTVGSGNHYVDILSDEAGYLWVAVHFGSRGFGWKTAKGFMNIAQNREFSDGKGEGEMDAPPLLLDVLSPSGQDYQEAMEIAGYYAYEGRKAVVNKVLEILGTDFSYSVHNHHNFTWREIHETTRGAEKLYVVRKGATPAFPGEEGFVGGSMGDISVILKGVESTASQENLYSTVHGAGRVMSRTQAAGKQKWIKSWDCVKPNCRGQILGHSAAPICPLCGGGMSKRTRMERLKNGLVDFDNEMAKLHDRKIIVRGAGADEAPPVYRPLQSVLDAHRGTIEILHTLHPVIVVMAGSNDHDPYGD